MPLLSPDGYLLSARWRPAAWLAGIGIVGVVTSSPLVSTPGNEHFPGAPANPSASLGWEQVVSTTGDLATAI